MKDTDSSLSNTNDSILTESLLISKASLDLSANTLIHDATMNDIISKKRLEENLY